MEVIVGPRSLRPVIVETLVVCVFVAAAPWMSGGQKPLAMLISAGALLLGAVLVWMQPGVRRLRLGPLMASFAALVGFAGLSLAWSANQYSTWIWVTQWLMAGLAFWLAYVVAGEPKGREWLLRGYLVSAVGFCAVAIWMYITSEYGRLTGPFYWANPAAAYLLPAIIVALDRARKTRTKKLFGWAGLTVLFLASFLLADSRTTTLVLMMVTGLYLLVAPTPKRFWITFVLIIATGFALSFGLAKLSTSTVQHSTKIVPGSRFAEAARGEAKSLPDRFYYLGSAFDMWFSHPLVGTGAGTYGDVHPQYQQRVVSASTSAHNLYVQTLAELGLVGAVAMAAVLLWLFVGSMKGVVANPEMVPVLLGLGGLLLHFGLDIDARYPALLMLAAILFGTVYRQWGEGRGSMSWRWPLVAALAMVPVVSLYRSDVWAERAQAAQSNGEYAEAADKYAGAHEGLVYNPDYLNAEGINLYAIGAIQDAQGKEALDKALERAREAQRRDPHDAQHHQLEGRVLAAKGDLAGAQAALREALKLDPLNHPDYALDLAVVQVRAGDAKAGVETAKAMLKLYPQSVVDNRNFDETLRPILANLEALIGNAALKDGRVDEAAAAAGRALKLDPKSLRSRALQHQVDLLKQPDGGI
jgi:O-antigen ligase